jgi:endonuclease/exonuclease/phosphatase family metal-dependent hydrolase
MSRIIATVTAAALATAGLLAGTAPAGRAAPAPTRSTPADGAIRVATYNICKTTCGRGRFGWANRRVAMVNAIRSADPDVLALQEANTQRWGGERQIDDVRQRLAVLGYTIASTDYTGCSASCTKGAHVFFKRDRLHLAEIPSGEVAAAGMRGMSAIADVDFGRVQDRAVSWAFLTPNGSGRTALYLSVHLPTQKSDTGERLRVAVARGLRPWADQLIRRSGLPDVEIVVAGDFNSFERRQPRGAQQVLADAGLVDGYAAPDRVNATYSTVNYQPGLRKHKGFPPRPYRYDSDPARIDYVFSTVAPLRHEVVLHLTSDGEFDDDYRASDHNMVMVDLPLR